MGIDEADEAAGADWVHLVTWRYGLEPTHESYLHRMYAEALGPGPRCPCCTPPMAHGLHERLGYRDAAMFEIWAEPDQVHL